MVEYIVIILLHTLFFIYLNLVSYVWLNNNFPISKTIGFFLVAAAAGVLLIHLFWPGIDEILSLRKLKTLLWFSVAPVFFHFFSEFAIARVERSMSATAESTLKFKERALKAGIILFQRLLPAFFMLFQLNLLWLTGNF